MNDIKVAALQGYRELCAGIRDDAPVTLLSIDTEQTTVTLGSGPIVDRVLVLPVGARKIAADYFKHNPATPLELENAIIIVEDIVMPMQQKIPPGSSLLTRDIGIREIAQIAGITNSTEMVLTLDAMELVFNRLAAIVSGRPVSHEAFADDPLFAARLLILREFMHHLRFAAITII